MEAGLSESFAEVGRVIVTFPGLPFKPERIDGQARCLHQKFAAIQADVNDVLNLKREEIAVLNKEVDKLQAENAGLKSRDSQIKELQKQVSELEAEKKIFKERVETLEHQIKELSLSSEKEKENLENQIRKLRDDLKEAQENAKRKKMSSDKEIQTIRAVLSGVKEENQKLHSNALVSATERQTLRTDVKKLERNNTTLQTNNTTLQTSNTKLQKRVEKLERNNTTLQTNNTTLQRKVEDLERKIGVPDDDLLFGQLCRCVESMIFEKILPKGYYNEKATYMLRDLDDKFFFSVLFKKDKRKISEANEAWRKLKMSLQWEDDDVRYMASAIGVIQRVRNQVAHPKLTLEELTALAQRMKDAGEVNGFHSADMVTQLTNVWKQLNSMP